MKTRLKVCGISTPDIAHLLVELGVDALGFIFHPSSPRNVTTETVQKICEGLPAYISKVGVFVKQSASEIMSIMQSTGLDTIQLHGDQDQAFIDELRQMTRLPLVLARRLDRLDSESVKSLTETGVHNFLLDKFDPGEYGGTGKTLTLGSDLSQSERTFIQEKVILAGGINSGNVEQILNSIRPYALDLSSSLEKTKGVKDEELIRDFIKIFQDFR